MTGAKVGFGSGLTDPRSRRVLGPHLYTLTERFLSEWSNFLHDVQEVSHFSGTPGISGEHRAVYTKAVWPHLCTSVRRGACS